MIKGGIVVLTTLDPRNADTIRAWLHDPRVNEWLAAGHIPISAAAERAFYEQAERDRGRGVAYHFEIHASDDTRLLGQCSLMEVDAIDRHGELSIFIGEPAEHRKGFGRDALVALLRFAFHTIGLRTTRIRAVIGNGRAIELYRSVGFSEAGLFREARYVRGRFHDVAMLDMTREEFDARHGD
jgi:RimJ/RimL family protein N-acetyltransferase